MKLAIGYTLPRARVIGPPPILIMAPEGIYIDFKGSYELPGIVKEMLAEMRISCVIPKYEPDWIIVAPKHGQKFLDGLLNLMSKMPELRITEPSFLKELLDKLAKEDVLTDDQHKKFILAFNLKSTGSVLASEVAASALVSRAVNGAHGSILSEIKASPTVSAYKRSEKIAEGEWSPIRAKL